MASFGRKNRGGGALGASSSKSRGGGAGGGESEAFKKMKEEMAERERYAKEFEDNEEKRKVSESAKKSGAGNSSDSEGEQVQKAPPAPNPRVFLDIEVRGPELLGRSGKVEASGRLEFELFADVVPRTAENFRCLCTGERGRSLHFEDSIFHRIIPGFMAQGGDITDSDGTGGKSIYGATFADEGFPRRHDARGSLSMANSGPNTNNSQFFILFKAAPHLDRKHVVFGRLLGGGASDRLLRSIEEKGTKSGDVKGVVKIVSSGELSSSSSSAPAASAASAASARKRSRSRSRSRSPKRRSRSRRRERR